MYYKTIEDEKAFLYHLYRVFDDWVTKRDSNAELGIEVVECDLICPKCKTGKIINYRTIKVYHKGLHSFKMKYVCGKCHEEFDPIRMREDIYNNTPYEMLDHLDTPLGQFHVLKNGEAISFRYWTKKAHEDEIEIDTHFVDIDTSTMNKGDLIFAGIKGAGFEFLSSDERCSYKSAENSEYFLVMYGVYIDEDEVDIKDYSFITEGEDGDGYQYLIHQNPHKFNDVVSHFCRVISLEIAWGRKDMCDDYESVIEMAVW